MKDKQKVDKIALDTAYFTPFWFAVAATEPDRMIDVRMTYADLYVLTELIDNEICKQAGETKGMSEDEIWDKGEEVFNRIFKRNVEQRYIEFIYRAKNR